MKNSEKILIENLFYRLKSIENTVLDIDEEALKFIHYLLKQQKNSLYYMVQTILIQETAIKELNNKVQFLEKRLVQNNNSSFLSNSLKEKILDTHHNKDQNFNKPDMSSNDFLNSTNSLGDRKNNSSVIGNNRGKISSFLGNALQTAVGVAGGMVAGNMLTSLFKDHELHAVVDDTNQFSHPDMDEKKIENVTHEYTPEEEILQNDNVQEGSYEYLDYDDDNLDTNYD